MGSALRRRVIRGNPGVWQNPGAGAQGLGCSGMVRWASQSSRKNPGGCLTRRETFHLALAGLALRRQAEGGHCGHSR